MSAVLGAHGFRTTKKIRRACDLAVGAFLVVGGGTWYVIEPQHFQPIKVLTVSLLPGCSARRRTGCEPARPASSWK
jgi:hypothetical protein